MGCNEGSAENLRGSPICHCGQREGVLRSPVRVATGLDLTTPLVRVSAVLGSVIVCALIAAGPAAAQDTRPEFVVASVGDSFASGEGNPLVPGQHDDDGQVTGEPEQWNASDPDAQQCHRSPLAHGGRAAEILQSRFPQFRIRFVHVACSGAQIGQGLVSSYRGVEPEAGNPLQPQVTQLNQLLGQTRIDALVVNIGVNDIGFGEIVKWCILFADIHCSGMTGLVDDTRASLAGLPTRFEILQASIRGTDTGPQESLPPPFLNALPGRVYLVEYPDPTRDEDGSTCHRSGDDDPFRNLTREELSWMQDEVLPGLNGAVRQAAENGAALGEPYTYVSGTMADSRRHGICASQPYFLSNRQALRSQGADAADFGPFHFSNGIAHPNPLGHASVAERVADAIDPQLRGRFVNGEPTLALAGATASAIDLRWSVPSTQAIERFELEIRPTTPGADAQTTTVPAAARTFRHAERGAFLYRIRACSGVNCTPFTPSVRASNVAASDLGVPRDLRQVDAGPPRPGSLDLSAGRSIEAEWERADDGFAYFELHYRRVRTAGDLPAPTIEGRDRRRVDSQERKVRRQGNTRFRDVGRARVELPAFSSLRSVVESARLGSAVDPIPRNEPYELKVRACSNVACSDFGEGVVTKVGDPPPGRVGDVDVDPDQLLALPGRPFGIEVGIDGRRRGNPIRTVDVRLLDERGEVGRVGFDSRDGELALFGLDPRDERGSRRGSRAAARRRGVAPMRRREMSRNVGRPRSRETLRSGPLTLSMRGSRARASRRSVRLRLSLRVGRELSGRVLTLQVAARDTRGRHQPFRTVGSLVVR